MPWYRNPLFASIAAGTAGVALGATIVTAARPGAVRAGPPSVPAGVTAPRSYATPTPDAGQGGQSGSVPDTGATPDPMVPPAPTPDPGLPWWLQGGGSSPTDPGAVPTDPGQMPPGWPWQSPAPQGGDGD